MLRASLAALVIASTGCWSIGQGYANPRPAPPPPQPAPTGPGSLYMTIISPTPGESIAVTISANGATVASGTAPSGEFEFTLPAGRYDVSFASAAGVAYPHCGVSVDVPAASQTWLNQLAPPRGCERLWERADTKGTWMHHRGQPSDISTAPGAYDGYRVDACDDPQSDGLLYVTGGGDVLMPENADRTHDAELNAFVERVRARVQEAMKPMAGGAGFGVSCRKGTPPTITVYVSDYRQVDETVRRLVTIIREDKLGIGFSIGLIPFVTLL